MTRLRGGHEALVEARVCVDDVPELLVQQGVQGLPGVSVEPDSLNKTVRSVQCLSSLTSLMSYRAGPLTGELSQICLLGVCLLRT